MDLWRRAVLFSRSRRSRPALAAAAVVAGLLLLVKPLAAQTPSYHRPAAEIRVARLITRLGSDAYRDRDQAGEELAALGAAARPQIEAATESDDPEVRLRAKELLRRIQVAELWSPSRVNYQARQAPAAGVLAALTGQTGNHVLIGDQYGTFHDQPVDLDCAERTFWEVIDELCRASGNRVRPHYDARRPGLVLTAGVPGKFPVAYAGPLRLQVLHARRVFTEDLDYEQLDSDRTHTFQLDLQAVWEDRFRLVGYRSQPELAAAITDTGVPLAATQPAAGGWNVAGAGMKQLSLSLRLHPPATTAKEIDTLRLKWGLIAVGNMAQLVVENLSSPEPHFQDDVELTIESFQQGPGPRCELTLLLIRDLVLPDPQELLFQESEVELFDDQGRAYRKQGQTNNLSERGATIKLTFIGEFANSAAKTLRFTYPRIRSERDLEIVFRHVPLPTGRPD